MVGTLRRADGETLPGPETPNGDHDTQLHSQETSAGHGFECRTRYSFNWQPGVGRTHGETVEQEWSHINGAVLMTREMGSGARHAALDDHWGGWNWRKLVDIGMFYFISDA